MGVMDETFGATYIGGIIATFLYGIMTLQTYIYWVKYVNDSIFDRAFVVVLWIVDTVQMAAICHMQYHYVITNYGNPAVMQSSVWSLNLEVGLTAVITFMVQVFFARRAWYFTKRVGSRFTTTRKTQLMGVAIGVISITQLGFGIASFVMTFVLGEFSKFIEYRWLVGVWLGSAALGDVMVVWMLSTALMTQRNSFGRTNALIDKLLRYTINTGLLTRHVAGLHCICIFVADDLSIRSIIAIVDLVAFCTMNNLVHFGFNFILGKLYTNTLLATLNARHIEPTNIVHVESSSYKLDQVRGHGVNSANQFSRTGAVSSQERSQHGIHLQTDTTVEISDEPRRRPQDRIPPKVVVLGAEGDHYQNNNKDIEYDADGADSFDTKEEGYKRGRGV